MWSALEECPDVMYVVFSSVQADRDTDTEQQELLPYLNLRN